MPDKTSDRLPLRGSGGSGITRRAFHNLGAVPQPRRPGLLGHRSEMAIMGTTVPQAQYLRRNPAPAPFPSPNRGVDLERVLRTTATPERIQPFLGLGL
jgi:hypothetical protein